MLELIITYVGWPNIYSDSITSFKDFLRSKINYKGGSNVQLDMVIPSAELTNYISDLNYMSNTKLNVVKNYNFIINNAIDLGYKPLFNDLPKGAIPQFAIIYDIKGGLVKWLRSKGVGANRWPWKDLPSNIRNSISLFPNANMFNERLVLLPIHQDISKSHCVKIISLLEVWNKRK